MLSKLIGVRNGRGYAPGGPSRVVGHEEGEEGEKEDGELLGERSASCALKTSVIELKLDWDE